MEEAAALSTSVLISETAVMTPMLPVEDVTMLSEVSYRQFCQAVVAVFFLLSLVLLLLSHNLPRSQYNTDSAANLTRRQPWIVEQGQCYRK